MAFQAADVSMENDVFIIERLFRTTKIFPQQYKKIKALPPFGYYLEFQDRKRVYVLFGPDEIVKQFTSSKSNNTMNEIEARINRETKLNKSLFEASFN